MNRFTLIKAKDFHREEIHFSNVDNTKVIGHAESGKVARISIDYNGPWIRAGEDWLCQVIKETDEKMIVYPLELVRSAEDNDTLSLAKIGKLKNDGFKKEFYKPENTSHFVYTK
jgi:hypothetical protein